MNKRSRPLVWVALGVPAVLILGRLGLAVLSENLPVLERHEALASWVEGIGSILAVVAALSVAVLDGRRSRIALERQADLQQQSLNYQTSQEEGRLSRRKAAAINAVRSAIVLYCRAAGAIFEDREYEASKSTYDKDLKVAQDIMSNVEYVDLIDKSSMAQVAHIRVMMSDFDDFIDTICAAKAEKSLGRENLYRSMGKRKINTMLDVLEILGSSLEGDPWGKRLTFSPEEDEAWAAGLKGSPKLPVENLDGPAEPDLFDVDQGQPQGPGA